jgi:hypothetical protein
MAAAGSVAAAIIVIAIARVFIAFLHWLAAPSPQEQVGAGFQSRE